MAKSSVTVMQEPAAFLSKVNQSLPLFPKQGESEEKANDHLATMITTHTGFSDIPPPGCTARRN